jgi:regulator of replication initiation timing
MNDREQLFGLLLSVALPGTDIPALNAKFCEFADELTRLRAEVEALKAEVEKSEEEWRRLDVEVQHFATLAESRAAENEALKLQRTAADLVHRETATTVLMQTAEIERLRADAARSGK